MTAQFHIQGTHDQPTATKMNEARNRIGELSRRRLDEPWSRANAEDC